ncbi:MAG TPA: ATP-dependent helicase HrpB [Geminicoccus sp.]|jgi:ATP-dependent helicase HrpB|uniref:ATP-dependent helicase HrpB n=1 Tax=Geminicoccus sp. TaxID=2024832 RepID=UPI002E322F02|nr:ATP-dependent helicase HrpB [Geminicoccus sp.]HEX2527322.1 ATP-dependent helicase HrpB [Geminicoccus sp.]
MTPDLPDLPIRPVLPDLARALQTHGQAVLEAPPGAGKTTLVPLALLDAPWRQGRKLVVLEPRRLAARAAASRMADLLGEKVGGTVGYAMRFERRIGPATVVEVLTEGLFLRRLQGDPELSDVAAVLFDEFHERSLDADLALALTLDMRAALRPDLRLVVMSATLDGVAVARLLGEAPVVRSEGRMFPVATRHHGRDPAEPVDRAVAQACLDALATEQGSILAFLPGQAEIGRAATYLRNRIDDPRVEVHPLFGDLPREAQDRAIRPTAAGQRKIVLATDIAETSLTIEGVRVVVDSGLARKPRFSPRTGTSALVTRRIALANAEQRRGRAGRLEPGVCLRLWPVAEERAMLPHLPPEITDADLVPLVLELLVWGVADPAQLAWLDPPPPAGIAVAMAMLRELGAVGADGQVTAAGRRMAAMPVHPRLAAMIMAAEEAGQLSTGIALAALLASRDLLPGTASTDLSLRLSALQEGRGDPARRSQALDIARQLGRGRFDRSRIEPGQAGALLAAAYPDRIGKRRGPGSYRLANGRGVKVDAGDPLAQQPWIVVAELDDRGADGTCRLAAAIDPADLDPMRLREVTETRIDPQTSRVVARRVTLLGSLELRASETEAPAEDVQRILVEALAPRLPELIAATPSADRLRRRVLLLRSVEGAGSSLPDLSDARLAQDAPVLLAGWLDGIRSVDAASRLDWHAVLSARLDHASRTRLDTQLPTHWTTPAGTRHAIDYGVEPPVLAVRLQEMFGAGQGPVLAGGRIPCVLHLLSPAGRPAAITSDLAGFWTSGWPATKKDLKGRYPKHFWPDDPASAPATAKVRPC